MRICVAIRFGWIVHCSTAASRQLSPTVGSTHLAASSLENGLLVVECRERKSGGSDSVPSLQLHTGCDGDVRLLKVRPRCVISEKSVEAHEAGQADQERWH